MQVSILTPDSKLPNLAAMRISAWHKAMGDKVELNFPLLKADFTYASVLFDYTSDPHADLIGGSKYPSSSLDPEIEGMKPDYSLYPSMDFSLGYTYKACPRTCEFCIVPLQGNDDRHYSIWDFHLSKFKRICLLNNNTLADLYWRDTFEEIIEANLTVIDQNGYDARLMTEESAWYLSRIKFDRYVHIAWDYMEHEEEILRGICHMKRMMVDKIAKREVVCYVLIGHTTPEEDLYRVMVLWHDFGIEPFVMPLDKSDPYQNMFARWVNRKPIFKTVSWHDYQRGKKREESFDALLQ